MRIRRFGKIKLSVALLTLAVAGFVAVGCGGSTVPPVFVWSDVEEEITVTQGASCTPVLPYVTDEDGNAAEVYVEVTDADALNAVAAQQLQGLPGGQRAHPRLFALAQRAYCR